MERQNERQCRFLITRKQVLTALIGLQFAFPTRDQSSKQPSPNAEVGANLSSTAIDQKARSINRIIVDETEIY